RSEPPRQAIELRASRLCHAKSHQIVIRLTASELLGQPAHGRFAARIGTGCRRLRGYELVLDRRAARRRLPASDHEARTVHIQCDWLRAGPQKNGCRCGIVADDERRAVRGAAAALCVSENQKLSARCSRGVVWSILCERLRDGKKEGQEGSGD